jgi:hypothetical protein
MTRNNKDEQKKELTASLSNITRDPEIVITGYIKNKRKEWVIVVGFCIAHCQEDKRTGNNEYYCLKDIFHATGGNKTRMSDVISYLAHHGYLIKIGTTFKITEKILHFIDDINKAQM